MYNDNYNHLKYLLIRFLTQVQLFQGRPAAAFSIATETDSIRRMTIVADLRQ